jgi:hypothetical protein
MKFEGTADCNRLKGAVSRFFLTLFCYETYLYNAFAEARL